MSDEDESEEIDELITGESIPDGMTKEEYIRLIKEDRDDS